jgi:hypothetical protein
MARKKGILGFFDRRDKVAREDEMAEIRQRMVIAGDIGPSESENELLDALEARLDESAQFRSANDVGMSLEDEWSRNGHRMMGNHWNVGKDSSTSMSEGAKVFLGVEDDTNEWQIRRSTLNRTGTSVISNVASQTQRPLTVRFEPAETNDPPVHYLKKIDGRKLYGVMLQPINLILEAAKEESAAAETEDEVAHIQDLSQQAIEVLIAQMGFLLKPDQLIDLAFESGQSPDDTGPTAPLSDSEVEQVRPLIGVGLLQEEPFQIINDKNTTEVAQMAFDNRWDLARGDQKFVTNEFLCNVFGNQWMRLQWHDDGPRKDTFSLENTHIMNVWIDHTHDDIADSDHVIADFPLDVDQAIAAYPEYEDEIKLAKQSGSLGASGSVRRGAPWRTTQFKRPMVVVRVGWLRHQKVPMSVKDALIRELVILKESDSVGEPILALVKGKDDDGVSIAGKATTPPDPKTAQASENWPTEVGILQITALPQINRVVRAERCPYWDIPFGLNTNIPRPDGSPYGQGEPVRLEDISRQINRLLTILDNHSAYYQFPQRYWPAETLAKLRAGNFQLHSRAGANIPLPLADWQQLIASGGIQKMTQQIPAIPGMYVNLLDRLLAEHDRISGDVDVRQGQAPFKGASGILVNQLQEAAAGPLQFKAKFTEYTVQRIALLAIDAMVKWMPEDEWAKIITSYERPVLRQFIQRMRLKEFNITVEVLAGKGVNNAVDSQNALTLYQAGLISKHTAMRRANVSNPDAELRRMRLELQEQLTGAVPGQTPGNGGNVRAEPATQPPQNQ